LNNSPTFLPFFVGTPFKENLNLHVVSEVKVALGDAFNIVEVVEEQLVRANCAVQMAEKALDVVPSTRQKTANKLCSE